MAKLQVCGPCPLFLSNRLSPKDWNTSHAPHSPTSSLYGRGLSC